MRQIALLFFCAGCLGSCCKSPAPQGGEGQACYPNDTCNVGLDCVGGQCVGPGPDCGNGVCDADETPLLCPVDCGNVTCGNDFIDGEDDEVCDGSDLGGQTCVSLGHVGGTLACDSDCADFDDTGCHSCGDSIIQIPELCDATNVGGITCRDMGYMSGTLACTADCLAHDISGCADTCVAADCDSCIAGDCAQDVCSVWIAACADNPDCLSLHGCLSACTEVTCQAQCNNQFPLGVTDYEAARDCLVCNPDVCYDECDGATVCP